MNFKDLQYSIGRLTTDVRSQLARNNPLQKQDTKALSMWIFNERNNLATMRTLTYQQAETNKVFQQWTKEELLNDKGDNGRDIEDIGDKLVKLLDKQVEIEQQYAAKYQQYRHAIKSIRDREDRLSDIREKKRTLSSRISNLTKSSPKSPKLRELQKELASLDRDTHDIELEMGDFKRFALKEAFYLRFNAMNEYAEKTAMIAGFGKYIVDLLDIAPTPASESTRRTYDKGQEVAMIFADAINAVEAWQPREGDERPTLATNTLQSGQTTDVDNDKDRDSDNHQEVTTGKPISDVDNTKDQEEKGKGKEKEKEKQVTGDIPTAATATATTLESSGSETQHLSQEEQEQIEEQPGQKLNSVEGTDAPPQLPPRSPLPQPSQPVVPTGYTTDAIASVTSDHKSPQHQETQQAIEQLDLYDVPPPAYEASQQTSGSTSPRNSDEPPVADNTKHPIIPEIQAAATPTLPPAPAVSHARPIAHEDKEQVDEEGVFQSPYQSHTVATPSTPPMSYYQQSPQPMHQHASPHPSTYQPHQPSYHQPHHNSTMMTTASYDSSMNWNVPGMYGGVAPVYHHGQYQQLYDHLTQRQQQGYVQRPYAEFQQQYTRPRQDVGGFRVPTVPIHQDTTTTTAGVSPPHLSADEEKRLLAERYAQEETQARQASIQTLHQERKPLPTLSSSSASSSSALSNTANPHKKSVIVPEGDEHGYKSSSKRN